MENSEKLWTGEVPNNWKFYKGKYIFGERSERGNSVNLQLLSPTQKFGVIPQSMYDELTSMKSVKVKEDTDLSTFKTIHKGDFCISLRSFQGGFEYSEYEGVVSPAYHVLYPKMDICAGYYKYLFKEQRFIGEMNSYCQSLRDGKNISYFDFGRTLIPFPPLSEQQSIADYLDETCSKIDEIIAEAKASIDEYKNLREAVISNATTRGIKKNRSLKSSGVEWLPEIPADWNVLSPKVVFTQRKDRAIKGERQLTASQKHGIMYQDDYMKEEGVRIVTVEKDFNILKHVEPDDFVISMRSFQGGLEYSYLRGCISSAYVMLIPNHKYVYSEYYKWFFKSDKYINALQSTSDLIRDGQALRYANFVKLKLFDIPIEEQKEIADYLNKKVPKIDSLIAEKESLINDLEAYKKSLIYEVVTGKRKVV